MAPLPNESQTSGDQRRTPLLSAREFQAILACVPDNYLILKPDAPRFTILAASDAFTASTNTIRDHIVGKGLFEVFPENPSDLDATGIQNLTASLMSVLKHKQPHRMAIQKYDIRGPDGGPFEERHWRQLNCPVLGEDGQVVHIVHTSVDVTQTIKLEERVQHALARLGMEQKRLYDLFMQAPAAVLILSGPELVVQLANPMMRKLWRSTSTDVTGMPVLVAFPDIRDQGFARLLENVYTTGDPHLAEEQRVHLVGKSEGSTDVDCFTFVLAPVRSSTEVIEGVMVFAYDVTEQVVTRQRIEGMARQKDEFIGIVSHELKTPLTSAKAYAQVLRNRFAKAGDEHSAALLSKMDVQLSRLRVLIDDLLDITRIDTGKLLLREEFFDFNDLVADVVEEMQRTMESPSIIARLAQSTTIFGDRDRTGQVLTNFISNAIKYSPDAGTILVTTASTNTSATACVHDSGIGISREMQEQVFERFFRADGMSIDTYPGIGLGLYICSEIVKRQQGRIWVESEIGKGSTFCFELPVERDGGQLPDTPGG
ncbi:hypothetical protein BH23CHL4_BH23CHL4_14810 [soil metagenome]